jgi:diguanylate cyclase (GGDEF)-like protein
MNEFKTDKILTYSMLAFILIPNDTIKIIIIMMYGRYSSLILLDNFESSIKGRKKINVYLASLIFIVGGLFNFIQIVVTDNRSNYVFLSSVILFMFLVSWYIIEKYKDESLLDELTEVYNKRYLLNYGEKIFDNYKNKNMSILMVDLDDFKKINDLYGHNSGDMILKSIANLIIGIIRKSDVISRFGGEEFVIIMPNTELKEAKIIAERIRFEIAQQEFNKLKCTVSIGLENNIGKNSFNEMFESADKKLYEAKKLGKNCVIG